MSNRQLYDWARANNDLTELQACYVGLGLGAAPANINVCRAAILAHLAPLAGNVAAAWQPVPVAVSGWRFVASIGIALLTASVLFGLFALRLPADMWQPAMIGFGLINGVAALGLLVYVGTRRAIMNRADRAAHGLTWALLANLVIIAIALFGRLVGFDATSANFAIAILMITELGAYVWTIIVLLK